MDLPALQSECAAHVAQRAFRAIGDDDGGDSGAVAAVFIVNILDDFFALLMLEIDIDVGGSSRSRETKRLNSMLMRAGSTSVMPSA